MELTMSRTRLQLRHLVAFFLVLFFFTTISAIAQNTLPIVIEAESGNVGSDFSVLTQGDVTFIRVTRDGTQFSPPIWDRPGSAARVSSYEIAFPEAGEYNLYIRARVGPRAGDDDSFFYGNGFGEKDYDAPSDWVIANQLDFSGFTQSYDVVYEPGMGGVNVWKWINLSQNSYHSPAVTFLVEDDNLTVTFQIGGRESNFDIDKIAFGRVGVYFTVGNLDTIEPGSLTFDPPVLPEPEWAGPPLATNKVKWVGNVYSRTQIPYFENYWNQVTPEDAAKWLSVAGYGSTEDPSTWSWDGLDAAYNFAKGNGYPFRFHVLVWGSQQPQWINFLSQEDQLTAVENWFRAVAERYPDIDFLEVVNEPIPAPPPYRQALGGTGVTGWDWVINAFQMARDIFPPSTRLMINEYGILTGSSKRNQYIGIINLLLERGLIDGIGVQGHAFTLNNASANAIRTNLNALAATGLPVMVTEFDLDGATDAQQLTRYQRVVPALYEHPAVEGITLWGWRPGMWRTANHAYVIGYDGATERPALVWLREYLQEKNLQIDIDHVLYRITNLPDLAFRNPAGDRRAELIYKIEEVLAQIELGEYRGAAQKLKNDIFPKVGGGKLPLATRWVIDPKAQASLTYHVTNLINALSEMADHVVANRVGELQAANISDVPTKFAIAQNYPNPFNPTTTIQYQVPTDVQVTLTVYNMLGQGVRTLVDQHQSAGYYSVIWDGKNNIGADLGSGMYIYRIKAGSFVEVKTMMFVK
jgi:endo-1,4-beta-xylanase